MKIAQVSPLYESVPPKYYGGTERVVSWLTEELVRRGHDVTLFASKDSATTAELRPVCESALRRRDEQLCDALAPHIRMLETVAREAADFDIIHYHTGYLHFPVARRQLCPAVTTLHGRLDIPDLYPLFREFRDMNLVSISKAQAQFIPWANWAGTVHHGLPPHLFEPGAAGRKRDYLAFLGRISREKRVDRAIEIARRAGMPLRVAAKIDAADREYYESEIRDLLKGPGVEYIGEITEHEKQDFLGNARALLFPIDWPEPFGLVLIEALATGTPVIAFGHGSVPEIVDDGITGFVVRSVSEAVDAVGKIDTIDRRVCRQVFEDRFSVQRMCRDYEEIYESLAASCAGVQLTEASSTQQTMLAT